MTNTGNGTIDAKENDCYIINMVKGDLTVENGTFYGSASVVQVEEGTLSVKGDAFDLHKKWEGSSKYLSNCIDDACAGGTANVATSGGTFVAFDPCAASDVEGAAYAKFVNITDLLQYKGGSLRMDVVQPSGCVLVTRWPFPKAQALLRTAGTSRRFRHLSRRMFAGWQTTMF